MGAAMLPEPAAAAAAAAAAAVPAAVPRDFVPCAESAHALYQLSVGAFSGPLDLLLFLIRRHQIDIFDIPIAFVCGHYLRCLDLMTDLQVDVAAEFLFMAAELTHIKSRLLLPQPPGADAVEEEEEDPRAALVRRLLAYSQVKGAALALAGRPWLGRDTFGRPLLALAAGSQAPPPALRELDVLALTSALDAVIARQRPEARHEVRVETVSVRGRMEELVRALTADEATPFTALLAPDADLLALVVTFLAILELTRMQLVRAYAGAASTLYLRPRFSGAAQGLARLAAQGADVDVDAQFAG